MGRNDKHKIKRLLTFLEVMTEHELLSTYKRIVITYQPIYQFELIIFLTGYQYFYQITIDKIL